jgi:hypothetical protein
MLTLTAAANPIKTQVVQLEELKINEGLVTDEIVKRFDTKATGVHLDLQRQGVEDRIRGLFAASLAQQLSATKLLQLAVRDESLKSLQKEWLTAEELGKSGSQEIGVENADYVATVRIEDFVADRKVLGNERAAIWKNSMTASFEISNVKTGTKKIITETDADEGKGRKSVGGEAANFDARQIKSLCDRISAKLASRILDNISPPKIIAARGNKIIIDRGRAAGVKVGDKFRLIERVDDSLGTDAGFPMGSATVEFVNEDTSNLNCDTAIPPNTDNSKVTLTKITQ